MPNWYKMKANEDDALLLRYASRGALDRILSPLTHRERVALRLRSDGLVYREIARVLNITTSRVNQIIKKAYRKMKAGIERTDGVFKDMPYGENFKI